MGLVISESQAALDNRFPTSGATDYVGYSTNGSSEYTTANLARTNVGATNWAAATAADPSVKQNTAQFTSGTLANAGATITHFAIFIGSGGAQRTDWQALDNARTLAIGDSLQWAANALKVTLT